MVLQCIKMAKFNFLIKEVRLNIFFEGHDSMVQIHQQHGWTKILFQLVKFFVVTDFAQFLSQ